MLLCNSTGIRPQGGVTLPALFAPDAATAKRVLEFFIAHIRNPHTRRAYAKTVAAFAAWCDERGLGACPRIGDRSTFRRLGDAEVGPPA